MRTLLMFLLLVSIYSSALAHKPLDTSQPATKDQPIVIREHQSSWVAYNRLTGSEDVDYYLLSAVQKGDLIDTTLLVPVIDRLANFRPVLALLGPGLPIKTAGLTQETIKDFLKIAPNEGVVVKTSEQTSEIFFEPFTQTKYWQRQSLQLTTPVSGQYYLAVFDPKENGDKYVLSIGKQENWKVKDIFEFPGVWWRVRMFTEHKRSTYAIVGFLILASLLLVVLLIKHYRQRNKE